MDDWFTWQLTLKAILLLLAVQIPGQIFLYKIMTKR